MMLRPDGKPGKKSFIKKNQTTKHSYLEETNFE